MAEPSRHLAVTIEDEMRKSYLDYAMSVIIGRALPDVRDGLKPVHRRILYSMHDQRIHYNQSYKKSARVVGDVLGKYHPHGDSAVYDALVRLAQTFSMRYPLVDGQGNFGSVDGDPAAAMRYTEVRLARFASDLLADIDKETVDFGPNFDDSEREPLVLPSRIPNLLVNGSGGIAVGMATNIPPHNLREVVDATIRLIENPDLTVDDLMQIDPDTGRLGVRGPDFPTAATIYGTQGIRDAYATGRGRVMIRAKAIIEDMGPREDRQRIVVNELPYQVNKAELLKKIAELVREKRIEGISDLRDESDRDGIRMVIELKRDAYAEVVLNTLYQMTSLQTSFSVHTLAIVRGRPKLLTLKDTLEAFIEHRREVVLRRTRYELRESLKQKELVEGLGMATTDVDLVVRTIRESNDVDIARAKLMTLPLKGLEHFVRRAGRPEAEIQSAIAHGDYFLSERQARAILEMRLSRLTGLEREKLATEYGKLCDRIAELERILSDDGVLKGLIIGELDEVKERYGDERRSEIVAASSEIRLEDLIADEEVVIPVTHAGYIKRVPLSEYRAQSRGGMGTRGMDVRDKDFVSYIFSANAHAHVLFLTNSGKAFLKRIYEIPEMSRAARGRAIVNILGLGGDESIAAVLPIREFVEDGYLLTCTTKGRVKRTSLDAYANIRSTGIIGVAIEEGDALLGARVVGEQDHVMLGTRQGMSIRFALSDVRPMGRDSRGVRGVDLADGDHVVGMEVIPGDDVDVLTVCANGYGKRTAISEWRVQNRAGRGVRAIETSERNGELVKLRVVREDEQAMLITNLGQVIRMPVADIRRIGRNTQGVRLIRLKRNEYVVDIEPLADEESDSSDHVADASEAANGDE